LAASELPVEVDLGRRRGASLEEPLGVVDPRPADLGARGISDPVLEVLPLDAARPVPLRQGAEYQGPPDVVLRAPQPGLELDSDRERPQNRQDAEERRALDHLAQLRVSWESKLACRRRPVPQSKLGEAAPLLASRQSPAALKRDELVPVELGDEQAWQASPRGL